MSDEVRLVAEGVDSELTPAAEGENDEAATEKQRDPTKIHSNRDTFEQRHIRSCQNVSNNQCTNASQIVNAIDYCD